MGNVTNKRIINFEDIKAVIRQYNAQTKKDNMMNNGRENTTTEK